MSAPGALSRDELVRQLAAHTSRHLPGVVGEPRVRVLRELRREASRLWMLDMEGEGGSVPLVVKQQLAAAWESGEATDRTRYKLAAIPAVQDRLRAEAAALSSIETIVREAANPALTAAHVYWLSESPSLLVLERVPGEELRCILLRAHRLRAAVAPERLRDAGRHAGEWLRLFHERMPVDGTRPLVEDADAFLRVFEEKAEEVARSESDAGWMLRHRRVVEQALGRVDAGFAMHALHGDFWPGNVIVRLDGRIAVLDTYAGGRAPGELDVAYFLLHLRALPPQIHSQGRWCREEVVVACEAAFLDGYAQGDAIDRRRLALFQILTLLYKWAASTQALERASGVARAHKRATLAWRARYYRRLLDGYHDALGQGG